VDKEIRFQASKFNYLADVVSCDGTGFLSIKDVVMKTVKDNTGKEWNLVISKDGKEMNYIQPTTCEMSNWVELFGQATASIMKANYYSHTKNGYVHNGTKVRNIRDFDGKVVEEMELKEVSSTSNKVDYSALLGLYAEVSKLPNNSKAMELVTTMVSKSIPASILEMPVEVLELILKLKKNA
jgi:hypothetical protein